MDTPTMRNGLSRNLFIWLYFTGIALSLTSHAQAVNPIVDLGYSQYQGVVIQDTNVTYTQFLGIRYAASPTGSRRFDAPAIPDNTLGVQQANAEPAMCYGAAAGTSPTTPFLNMANTASSKRERLSKRDTTLPVFSEDCLFLNVYTPGSIGQNSDFPVVVWIHGGGYGSGSADPYDGKDLIRESGEGVVAVAIQYRLGLFGFLPGQKVKDGGALNAGLLDQQFALQWVQTFIQKFGGDPTRVTIWGESAGAGSVLQHLVANGGRTDPPLFRNAITSSTFLPSQYMYNDTIPEFLYSKTVSNTNCSSASDTLSCLRSVDVAALQKVNIDINNSGFFGTFLFVPVVDGIFITERPTQLLAQGMINGVNLLTVINTQEGAAFVDQGTANTVQIPDYLTQLFPNLGSNEVQAATLQYAGLGSNITQAEMIMGECPLSRENSPFLLAITQTTYHTILIPQRTSPANVFAESFLNFVMFSNPNMKWDPENDTPVWLKWNGTNEMTFNQSSTREVFAVPSTTSDALLQRCEFWESVSAFSSQ